MRIDAKDGRCRECGGSLEIVAADEADKERARERYAFYKKRGYEINMIDVEG